MMTVMLTPKDQVHGADAVLFAKMVHKVRRLGSSLTKSGL